MNIRILYSITFLFIILLLISCGEKSKPQEISISGTVGGQGIIDYPDKPVLVAAIKNGDFGKISANPLSNIIKLISVDNKKAANPFPCSLWLKKYMGQQQLQWDRSLKQR